MSANSVRWIREIASGEPLPSGVEVVRVLSTEDRPIYGTASSRRYYVCLVEAPFQPISEQGR